ncbi:uroporphyrinogen decarboxylase [Plebeiibacterium sediminum]|uniref:Uroporphyrinogen decarboxylase n=1 Tax=Plebeiibacterium sediminum TaxID=2992112 RepID=A0AAE3SDS4_9BACT|nr:uroporphyrinogen decarboxylase [Plebeiobacterium sediminum]MCW3785356.1 uroporphyrinogen decarboxylase [Plebeiobacterium sediminum]
MNDSLLLKILAGEKTERPPFWFMRQAGRVLPSYMKLKEKYSFWEMMQDPKLGAKVTLLPIDDLGVDAAILFSDILVIPYAMGMGLDFTDRGPEFDIPLSQRENPLADLKPDPTRLNYIYDVIKQIIATKPAHIPLIGFCGAPLTVLCYMLEGIGRSKDFPITLKYLYQNKETVKKLIEVITDLSIIYAKGQINNGVKVFQLFETHAGLIPFDLYKELFFPAVKKIAQAVREEGIPFIYFPKDLGCGIKEVTPEMCDFLSIDWQTPIDVARKMVDRNIGLQGNIDPRLLYADQKTIESSLNKYIDFGSKNHDWIINLGHGFLPDIPYENAKFLADWIKNTNWQR